MALSDIDALVTTANTQIDAENWSGAFKTLLKAKALLAVTPDAEKGDRRVRIRGMEIDSLLKSISSMAGAAQGIQRTEITWKPAT